MTPPPPRACTGVRHAHHHREADVALCGGGASVRAPEYNGGRHRTERCRDAAWGECVCVCVPRVGYGVALCLHELVVVCI